MAKKEKKIDEEILSFAAKIFFSLTLALLVALGVDVYHAVNALGTMYAS